MTAPLGPGTFVAVVGASGVGKDALLGAARAACGDAALFPRRAITRPPGPGEDFDSLSEAEFKSAAARGAFAVSWRAHGLRYGIPVTADDAIRRGLPVVANVSRGAIGHLEERYEHVRVVRITVSDEVRAERLLRRGRESGEGIARRLERADPAPERVADLEIRNDGTVAEGSAALLRMIASTIATLPSTARHGMEPA